MTSLLDIYLNARHSERMLENCNFGHKALRATRHWKLQPSQRISLDRMFGLAVGNGDINLADTEVRSRSCRNLVDSLRDYWSPNLDPDQQTYFITFCPDLGFTSDRSPVLRVKPLKRLVQCALREMGLSAIAQAEVQPIVNWPQGGHGRTLMLHAHAIGWGEIPENDLKNIIDRLNRCPAWHNRLQAAPILFRTLDGGMAEALQLAYYLDKLPTSGSNRAPLRRSPGEYRFWPTQKGYRDELALRIMEGLSQISILDSVFAAGDGVHVRGAWKARLLEWRKPDRQKCRSGPAHISSLWATWRQDHGSKHFAPYRIE